MKRSLKLTTFIIPVGIAVNLIGGQIALLLKLPLFLDSIGTITVGALCGPWAGALVGALTNVFLSITNPQTLFYIVNNILFGVLSGLLARRGYFAKLAKVLPVGVLYGVLGGTIGATISILFFDALGAGATGLISGGLQSAGFPPAASAYASELFADLLDKIPTVLIVYFTIRSIPKRTLVKLPQGNYFLPTPPSREPVK